MLTSNEALHEALVTALHEHSFVVQMADSQWSSPTLTEALRIADFVVEFLEGFNDA